MRIEGVVYFSEIPASFAEATVIIKIEDTSHVDAAAEVIFEHRLTGVSRSPDNRDPVPFVIDLPTTERLSRCSLRVHVDVNSTEEITFGDYVSIQSYPLKNDSSPVRLQVIVHPIK